MKENTSTRQGTHMKRPALIASGIAVVLVMFFGGWVLMYPSPDPKNIKYVLWKADLYKLNVDEATGTMVGDRYPDKLVVGKTKSQLRKKFGSLLPAGDASTSLQDCYHNSAWNHQDVLFIGHSWWMVAFNEGNATNLVLLKPC